MADEEHHEVVVVGGGPAGVSCALECFDLQLDTVLLEANSSLGGQLVEIPHVVRNVAFAGFERGRGLQPSLEQSATILGDRVLRDHRVTSVDLDELWVESGGRRFHADALVIASGATRRRLAAAVDGAWGGDVTYQMEWQPGHLGDRAVAVIGGGDSAALDALELVGMGSSVTLIHRSEQLTARRDIVEDVRKEPRIVDLPGWELESVYGTDHLEGIVIVRPENGARQRLTVSGLVVKISHEPATGVFVGQLALDRGGAVVVDDQLRTSQRGVCAVGDVTAGSYPRIATAVGQGVLAARSVLRQLDDRS
jgi:thioredoxin reductase (NADPH)